MKDRATILCSLDDKLLLVARARSRWSLPGGTIKRSESPLDAARRELEEEHSTVATEFTYLFQFGGLSKRHFVFFAKLSQNASPEPRNEISRCGWFSPTKISTLAMSIPAREIVALYCRREKRGETTSAVTDKPNEQGSATDRQVADVIDAATE